MLYTKTQPIPLGPYTQAIEIENIIFISGQIPMHPITNFIPENIYDQTSQSLKNIKNILELKNLNIKNIVKTTLFITNINDLNIINDSYKQFFLSSSLAQKNTSIYFPARSCVEVSKLPKNVKIEIDAIAMRY